MADEGAEDEEGDDVTKRALFAGCEVSRGDEKVTQSDGMETQGMGEFFHREGRG